MAAHSCRECAANAMSTTGLCLWHTQPDPTAFVTALMQQRPHSTSLDAGWQAQVDGEWRSISRVRFEFELPSSDLDIAALVRLKAEMTDGDGPA
jgi:hypothetical protein